MNLISFVHVNIELVLNLHPYFLKYRFKRKCENCEIFFVNIFCKKMFFVDLSTS